MKYAVARKYADSIVGWLAPFCEQLDVVGSIRRKREECGDVDIVAIPKVTEARDLLGERLANRNLLKEELERYVRENNYRGVYWLSGEKRAPLTANGPVMTGSTLNFFVKLVKCELNVFCGTPENYGALKLIYTGSKEHNIRMIAGAKALGFELGAKKGLWKEGVGTPLGQEEESVFVALGMSYIQPEDRR